MPEQNDTTIASPMRLSATEGAELLERKAQQHFGISAEEFRRRWDSGALSPDRDLGALEVAMLLPLGRP
jgi:hypothetical protein